MRSNQNENINLPIFSNNHGISLLFDR